MVIFGKILVLVLAICALAMTSGATWAQNQTPNKVWIQVDAQRTLPQAEARATLYESSFPNLKGYRLDTDWYVLAIGPFKKDEANKLLAQFIYASKIPMDSYVTKGLNFTEVFWPRPEGELPLSAAATPKSQMPQALEAADSETPVVNAATPMASAVTPAPRSVAKPTLVKPNFNDQDLERARASLDALSTDKKRQIQNALRWFGTYLGPIDGQIGSGSRKSIEEWQKAQGIDPTGALTPNQRTWLLANFDLEAAELGWEKVTDTQAGITFSQPRNLVHFSNYEPPFARYMPLNGGQTNLSLISQSGDRSELRQLFNVLRDLEAVPKDADAGLSDHGFIIQGMGSGRYVSIYAQLIDNTIKGFALFTPTRPDKSERRIAAFLKRSFTPSSSDVLRDDIAPLDDKTRNNLTAGLEARRPILSRSGFFVSTEGDVLTSLEVAQSCSHLTIEGGTPMALKAKDTILGLALLSPQTPLAPQEVALWQSATPRADSKVILSAFSYEDQLPSPTLTLGHYRGDGAKMGKTGRSILDISTFSGDAGGPVFDRTGAVLGMMLPTLSLKEGQLAPKDVGFAVEASFVRGFLHKAEISSRTSNQSSPIEVADIAEKAEKIVVLVSCWAQ